MNPMHPLTMPQARIASAVAMKQGQRAMFRERQLLSA